MEGRKKKLEKPRQFNIYKQRQYLKGADGSVIPARKVTLLSGDDYFFPEILQQIVLSDTCMALTKQAKNCFSGHYPEQR